MIYHMYEEKTIFTQEPAYTTSTITLYGASNIEERCLPHRFVTDYISLLMKLDKRKVLRSLNAKLARTTTCIVLYLLRLKYLLLRLSSI